MKPEFNNSGVSVQTFDEILTELVAEYKVIYGADIDLSQNTPDGQRVGIEARLSLDLQSYMQSIYNVLDPDLSSGELLRKVIKLAGVRAKSATQSTVDIDVTVTADETLPAGFEISGDDVWVLNDDVAISSGTTSVTFTAKEFGSITAQPSTITKILSGSVASIVSVTNPLVSTVGRDEENDEELRLRRRKSTENPAYSTVGSLYAALSNLDGVTDVAVYENKTKIDNAVIPLGANSIWCIIEGGSSADILKAIAISKTTGCDLKGSISGNYIEQFTRPDSSKFNYTHEIDYDTPTITDLTIAITAVKLDPAFIVDEELIKSKIAEKSYYIGDDVYASELYGNAYQAGTTFYLEALTVNGGEKVDGISNVRFNINTANITVAVT